jgi:hypothetical protein
LPSYLIFAENGKWRLGEKKMPTAKKMSGIDPLPRYLMPDASEPDYDLILEQLHEYHKSQIGSSYYYIWANEKRASLCRIVYGGGKIFFHEMLDHEKYGISDDDLEEAVNLDQGSLTMPGYHIISPHIETKLRTLEDY